MIAMSDDVDEEAQNADLQSEKKVLKKVSEPKVDPRSSTPPLSLEKMLEISEMSSILKRVCKLKSSFLGIAGC